MSVAAQVPAEPVPLEESILRSLRQINQAVAAQSRQLGERYQVTLPQLLCLKQLTGLGTTTPSALASAMQVSQATVTGMIDRLEARGYVRRARSSVDKRKIMLDLTEQGAALAAAAPSPLQERLMRGLQSRSPRWRAAIDLALRELADMIGAGEEGASAPMLGGDDAKRSEPAPEARS